MNSPDARRQTPDPSRILIRGANWLGDAVMTTPALRRLRETFPETHMALLAPEKLKDLWLHHPAINETIYFSPDDNIFAVAKKLSAGKFDLALVLPNSPRAALEVFLAGIPQRIGYARPWRNSFLTQTVAPRADAMQMRKRTPAEINTLISRTPDPSPQPPAAAHQIHEYLHLAAALGANAEPIAPRLVVAPEEIEAAKKKFRLESEQRTGETPVPLFGLNPGAEYGPAKRWPAANFIAAARAIQKRTNCVWLIFGGKADAELAERINSELGTPNAELRTLAGQTSLRELMALLRLCRVLLTNDSGPMHVAAALGTPVVAPFGSTSPELTGPGLPGDVRHRLLKSAVPCAPCFRRECPIDLRCMTGITVERVVEAVLSAVC